MPNEIPYLEVLKRTAVPTATLAAVGVLAFALATAMDPHATVYAACASSNDCNSIGSDCHDSSCNCGYNDCGSITCRSCN